MWRPVIWSLSQASLELLLFLFVAIGSSGLQPYFVSSWFSAWYSILSEIKSLLDTQSVCVLRTLPVVFCQISSKPLLVPIWHTPFYSTSYTVRLAGLRSANFCSSSSVFCHSWVSEIPPAKCNILSPNILWTNWPDLASFPCSHVCNSSGLASSVSAEFEFAWSTFLALARESKPYLFPWPPGSEAYLAKWHYA